MKMATKYFIVLLFTWVLIACGGGSGGTTTTAPVAANITSANEKELGTAVAEGAKQALNGKSAPSVFGRAQPQSILQQLNESIVNLVTRRIGFRDLPDICSSGTATLVTSGTSTSTNNNSVITYNNCVISGSTVNGVVNITTSTSGSVTTISFTYVNFTITIGSDETTINLSATCTIDSSSSVGINCNYSSSVNGIDGRTYAVTGSTITGNNSSGYTISATITDPNHGTVTMTTTSPILFNCSNGQPSSGAIQFTDGSGVLVTVTFNDCTMFTVSYSGTSSVYNWPT